MISQPRFVAVFATASCLGLVVTLWLVPAEFALARIAPERYLAGARSYYGTANISDEIKDSVHVPPPIVAWRRLIIAGDTTAFVRLSRSATPAGRLYGMAGLRAFARAIPSAASLAGHGDSVFLNTSCQQRYVSLAIALHDLDQPGWPDSLRQAPVECR